MLIYADTAMPKSVAARFQEISCFDVVLRHTPSPIILERCHHDTPPETRHIVCSRIPAMMLFMRPLVIYISSRQILYAVRLFFCSCGHAWSGRCAVVVDRSRCEEY